MPTSSMSAFKRFRSCQLLIEQVCTASSALTTTFMDSSEFQENLENLENLDGQPSSCNEEDGLAASVGHELLSNFKLKVDESPLRWQSNGRLRVAFCPLVHVRCANQTALYPVPASTDILQQVPLPQSAPRRCPLAGAPPRKRRRQH